MLQYREHQVNPSLATYVKKVWVLDNANNPNPIINKAVLPNGCFNFALVEGEGADVTIDRAIFTLKRGIYFCGQMTKALNVNIKPHTKITLVQLFAWAPSSFFSTDMSQFKDSIVEVKTGSKSFAPFLQRSSFSDDLEFIAFLNEYADQYIQYGRTDELLKSSCQLIIETKGHISIKDIIDQLGGSVRLLQKKFNQAVGISPKEYVGIIKLREAVDSLAFSEEESPSITQIALENNYYDQAHFTHTFKRIIKITPKKFNPDHYLLAWREKE